MLKVDQFIHLSTYLIAKEAHQRDIVVKRIIHDGHYDKASLLELRHKNRVEYIVGQRISKESVIAYWLQKNKYYAKIFFRRSGLSVATGEVFPASHIDEITTYARRIGYPLVVKPVGGIHGTDVFIGIANSKELRKIVSSFSEKVLIEKQFSGEEYRIFATRTKFVAAAKRIPANVIGDGVHTIKQLIAIKNKDPRRGSGYKNSLISIKVDKTVQDRLRKSRLTLNTIPQKGHRIFLRENSNLSTGGDSIDVTDNVHPDIKKIAMKTIRAIPGLPYAGIDFLTNRDISKKPTKNSYIIIEVNDSPMISMHHEPYEGKARNVAAAIIDLIYPETKK